MKDSRQQSAVSSQTEGVPLSETSLLMAESRQPTTTKKGETPMQWNLRRLLIVVAALMVLSTPMMQAQETETLQAYTQTLRWKNGDVLPGRLLESTSGVIRWESPYFSDDLVVDIGGVGFGRVPKTVGTCNGGFPCRHRVRGYFDS